MSEKHKKMKREWRMFINPNNNRITYNPVCVGCIHECKQSYKTMLVACPKYESIAA